MPGDGRSGSHGGTDQVGASTLALATFKVAVTGRGTAFAFGQLIAVHGDTHAASRLAPLKTCLAEDSGKPLFFSHATYLHRARHNHRTYVRSNMFAFDRARRHAQVLQGRVSAAAHKSSVRGYVAYLLPRFQIHIL